MYEAFESCVAEFGDLRKTLDDPLQVSSVDKIRSALEATAKDISETAGATELDRSNLAKLHRGMLAASRILLALQGKSALPRDPA